MNNSATDFKNLSLDEPTNFCVLLSSKLQRQLLKEAFLSSSGHDIILKLQYYSHKIETFTKMF